jgi:hypothetical protein
MSDIKEEEVLETETPVVVEEVEAVEEVEEEDPIEKVVNERLSKMKANMDRMVSERDEALKIKNQMEADAKASKLKQLEDEGKLQEIAEMKIADLEAKLGIYEVENTKLNRDAVLNTALNGLDFRTERSRDMARKDIMDQLVQDPNGAWRHTSGMQISDFVESYSKSDENSFLFRVKSNSGAGTSTSNTAPPSMEEKKSLKEMTTQEMLTLAAKGQLGNFKY